MQINTDIYVLHKSHLTRLVQRYPAIRSQIMVIADHRYRLAKTREAYFAGGAAVSKTNMPPELIRASLITEQALTGQLQTVGLIIHNSNKQ